MNPSSLFIAIEGGDGAGKATQTGLLVDRLSEAGYDVLRISFPQHNQPSAKFADRYLNGNYGGTNDVHPELASLAYAIDRYAASSTIQHHLQKEKSIVIADRYVASNLAHQGTKVSDAASRKAFYDDILQLEYVTLGIPKPVLNIVLLVPSSVAQQNIDQKETRSYTEKKRDIHEADADHLELAKVGYEELCRIYPDEFAAVECMKNASTMRTIAEIHNNVWERVSSLL